MLTFPRIALLILSLLLPIRHLSAYLSRGETSFVFGKLTGNAPVLLLLLFMMSRVFLGKAFRRINLHGVFIFCYFLLVAFLVILASPNEVDHLGRGAFAFNTRILLNYFIWFFLGLFITRLRKDQKYVALLWVVLLLNTILNFNLTFFRISFEGFDQDKIGMYLFLGDSFALWTLLFLATLYDRPLCASIVMSLSVPVLFALNSRTSLYAFMLVIPAIIFLVKKSLRYFLTITLVLLSFLILFSSFDDLMEKNKRMFAFLSINSDNSVQKREFLMEEGLASLKKEWFAGDYAGQLRYGSHGSYMHNYLSLWRQFGFTPFVLFLIFLLLYVVKASRYVLRVMRRKYGIDASSYFFIFGGAFCLIEILAARSYNSPYIWLFFGMCFSPKLRLKKMVKSKDLQNLTLKTNDQRFPF